MNCRSVRQLISPYLDHQLTGREMLAMQDHFSRCVSCADEMHSILQVKCLLRGLHTPGPRRDLSDAISTRLRQVETGAGGWHVLSLPPTLSFTSLNIPSARPPRGRRLATALGLSCLTILSIAAPFAPATRDGAQMTSGFLSSAFLMSPVTGPSGASLSGPTMASSAMTDPTLLTQASAPSMPVGVIGQPILSSAPAMPQSDFLTLTADQPSAQRRLSVFPAQTGHSNAIVTVSYSH